MFLVIVDFSVTDFLASIPFIFIWFQIFILYFLRTDLLYMTSILKLVIFLIFIFPCNSSIVSCVLIPCNPFRFPCIDYFNRLLFILPWGFSLFSYINHIVLFWKLVFTYLEVKGSHILLSLSSITSEIVFIILACLTVSVSLFPYNQS